MIWIVLLGAAAYSQSVAGLGALSGSVRGASGAFISGAQVHCTDASPDCVLNEVSPSFGYDILCAGIDWDLDRS